MKNFLICVLIVLCVSMFTGAWRGDFTNPFWDDMVFKKNVTVTDTLLIGSSSTLITKTKIVVDTIKTDGVIHGSSGEKIDFTANYLKLHSGSGGSIRFCFPASAMTFNSSAFATTTDNQTDLGAVALRWTNIYASNTTFDTIKIGGGVLLHKIDTRNDSLLMIIGNDTFVALKK